MSDDKTIQRFYDVFRRTILRRPASELAESDLRLSFRAGWMARDIKPDAEALAEIAKLVQDSGSGKPEAT